MEEKHILTIKELAEYIRLNEKNVETSDKTRDSSEFLPNGSWKFELVSIEHHLQKELIESNDKDLDLVIRSNGHLVPLSQMTDETLINLDFHAETKNKALSKLAKIASMARVVSSYEELYLELKNRENLSTTAIGNGVAIPHSRFPYPMIYKRPKLIIARSGVGVDFDAPDNKKVKLFFMPCAPNQFIHLRILAQIAKIIHFPGMIEKLRKAATKQEFLTIIKTFEQSRIPSNFLPHNLTKAEERQNNKTA